MRNETGLTIHLLGQFEVFINGVPIPPAEWKRRKARSLVKLLALAPQHTLHREEIIERLWPDLDGDAASSNLRLILHHARRALRSVGDDSRELIHLHDEQVSLHGPGDGSIRVDVRQFEEAALAARRSHDVADFETAIDLYTGDLLPEDRYEDWAAAPREVLRETWLGVLMELARLYEARGAHAAAIRTLERVVATDATHEDAHVGLMRLYSLTGRPGQALRQYARLQVVLARELDVEPSTATQRLHADIAAGRFPALALDSQPLSRQEPPPPAGPSSINHNLPAALTRFIGRQQEIADIRQLLPAARVLTLTGTGGAGKTRLALEVAAGLISDYRDGVWLVEFAPLDDPSLVPGAVSATVGVREQPEHTVIDSLVEALRGRSLLLILDNCEHLIDACASLTGALLAACPHLRILATSREALRVPGEVIWRVPSLSLPPPIHAEPHPSRTASEHLATSEAVALFIDRVQWVRPNFVLTSENILAVVQICQQLDGLPLALELAAARAAVLDPHQLAERLDDALTVLSNGSRTAPSRQQTLQATLDWSYALLDAHEQALLQRLAVFADSWSLEAAEEVCAGTGNDGITIDGSQVFSILASLVAKSIVWVEDGSAPGPSPPGIRYRLLETVRQYAVARLENRGDAIRSRDQHAEYYLALVIKAEPELMQPSYSPWLDRLEHEHGNLRAALRWSIERNDVEMEARLCSVLWRFWYLKGHFIEGDRWLRNMLTRLDTADIAPLVRGKVFQGAGVLAWNRGDPARSEALSRQALPLFEETGDEHSLSITLHALGIVAGLRGDYLEARNRYLAALRIREKLDDIAGSATTLHSLGNVARELGDLTQAADLYQRSVTLQRQIGNKRGIALALSGLAVVALDQGNDALSETLSTQCLEIYRSLGATSMTITILNNLGYTVMRQGDAVRSVTIQAECLQTAVAVGDKRGIAYGLEGVATAIALVDASPQNAERAVRLFGAADALRELLQVPLPPADRALNEPSIATARTALGDSAYDTVWRAGRALALDDAVAEALAMGDTLMESQPALMDVSPSQLLTPREREVVVLVAQGHTNREIASQLGMANRTVDTHVSNLLRKLGLSSRAEVLGWAVEHHLIPSTSS